VPKEINIPADQQRIALDEIKARQRVRKDAGTPKNLSLKDIYQAQLDILENQARQENMLREILARR
jgi:hypothetical protein